MVVADQIGAFVVDPCFADPAGFSSLELILGAYAYAFQIFLDFSAYSDIAIGLGRVFGLTLPVNFRLPYVAANPREFWQRWHITLSTWLRDYLYIPLGGSRGSTLFTLRNLMITMLLGGLWHGAGGNFVIWGGLHGAYQAVHRLWTRPKKGGPPFRLGLPKWIRVFFFFQFICLAWIFFRSQTMGASFIYLAQIANWSWGLSHVSSVWLILLAAALVLHYAVEPLLEKGVSLAAKVPALATATAFMGLFMVFYVLAENDLTHQAFIYFQF